MWTMGVISRDYDLSGPDSEQGIQPKLTGQSLALAANFHSLTTKEFTGIRQQQSENTLSPGYYCNNERCSFALLMDQRWSEGALELIEVGRCARNDRLSSQVWTAPPPPFLGLYLGGWGGGGGA